MKVKKGKQIFKELIQSEKTKQKNRKIFLNS